MKANNEIQNEIIQQLLEAVRCTGRFSFLNWSHPHRDKIIRELAEELDYHSR
jgi:Ni,Fe-hydrogenase I small subunit